MRVEFFKGGGRRYRSRLHRPDGVVVEFDGGSYNGLFGTTEELPHDLAHLIVEDELAVARGVWGVMAAGGLFKHLHVVSGRQRPHATATGRALVKEAHEDILRAELLVRAVCDAPSPDPAIVGETMRAYGWTTTFTREQLERTQARLSAGAQRWHDLFPDSPMLLEWPAAPKRG
ncbi:MAG: hypothetical protein QOF76_2207 [Solirubrobacteraceae bacterium]|jgi:hypothetical protein|nr:hypothetical protein [Solirubrobacteraceae bacterium]